MFRRFQPLVHFLKNLRYEGSFARNFTITFSGNTAAIIVGFIFTPFIARVYNPEAYGFFALFVSVVSNLSVLATFQLPRAFVLPESEPEFNRIAGVAFLLTAAVILLSTLVLILFGDFLLDRVKLDGSLEELFILLIPVAVLLYALNDIFKSWNVRRKFFARNAVMQISSSLVARTSTLTYGVATAGNSAGLVIGDLISKVLENLYLGRHLMKNRAIRPSIKDLHFFETLRRYRSYPLLVLPGVWIQAVITQLPVYFASLFYSSALAGHYSFANSLLNLPVVLLAGAVAPVFLQKAAEMRRSTSGDLRGIVRSLADRLFYAGLVPMLLLTVFGDYIFRIILGSPWELAGEMASFMGIYFFFLILHYPLASLFRIYHKEYINLLTTLAGLVLATTGLWIGHLYNNFMLGIALFSAANLLTYLSNIYVVLTLSGLQAMPIILRWAMYFSGSLALLFLIRSLIESVQ